MLHGSIFEYRRDQHGAGVSAQSLVKRDDISSQSTGVIAAIRRYLEIRSM